jgi:hypothetical protein
MAERGDKGEREEDFPIYKSCDLRRSNGPIFNPSSVT